MFYDSRKTYETTWVVADQYASAESRYKSQNVESTRFYRIDIAEGGAPKHIKTATLPAFYFFPAQHKEVPYVQYTGEVDTAKLIEFIDDHRDILGKAPVRKREFNTEL